MSTLPATLNADPAGRVTSADYGDRGDGTTGFFGWERTADGGDATQGAKADPAIADPTVDASVVSLLKGLLSASVVPTPVATTALVFELVASAVPAVCSGIVGYSTLVGFVQIHDAGASLVGGEIPLVSIPVTANAPFSIDFAAGLDCSAAGIVVALSTTGASFTPAAPSMFVTALVR